MKLLLSVAFLVVSALAEENVSIRAGFTGGTQPCYTTESNGESGGFCIQDDCCAGGTYISNLCPDYQSNVRCCYSYNSCNTGTGSCTLTVKNLACDILAMHEAGKIFLKGEHFDNRGNDPYDGASSLSNIRDTCYGKQAKRSKYCAEAPGGYVCLTAKMLTSLRDYAQQYYNDHRAPIEVNALAGSCHSSTSWHYEGNTFDVGCTYPTNHCSALTTWCRNQSPVELCYPGGPCAGHDTWVHCAH